MSKPRDPKFYSELKQMNDDLLSQFRETHEKSPYYDYTPTFEDYIKQFKELEQKFPINAATITTTTTAPLFQFGKPADTSTSTTNAGNTSFFSFSLAKKDVENKTSTQSAPPTIFSAFGTGSLIPPVPSIPVPGTSKNQTETDEDDNNGDEADDPPPPEPKVDKYEEVGAKHSVRCKLYLKNNKGESGPAISLLGLGMLYIKSLEAPGSVQVIVRQEPDLRRVLLNEVVTSDIPVKILTKAVQFALPGSDGAGTKIYVAKVKDDADAKALHGHLTFTS